MRIRVPTELLPVMRDLGADPVNMPMGEVYSALAKGIVDGVVAPADTFNALYVREAERSAAELDRYGIDGLSVLRAAQASIGPDGVECRRGV